MTRQIILNARIVGLASIRAKKSLLFSQIILACGVNRVGKRNAMAEIGNKERQTWTQKHLSMNSKIIQTKESK